MEAGNVLIPKMSPGPYTTAVRKTTYGIPAAVIFFSASSLAAAIFVQGFILDDSLDGFFPAS